MSNNLVVLSCSSRSDGNTDRLTAAFIEGAEFAGKSVTLFCVADMKSSPHIKGRSRAILQRWPLWTG